MNQRNLEDMTTEELIRELRRLQAAERSFTASLDEADPGRLVHELHVYQMELEMQNRELRAAQEHLEESRSRYADLYDFAPVGYCTLDPTGQIQEINFTGAALLGASRDDLTGKEMTAVASLRDPYSFHAHMKRCAREKCRVTSELTLSLFGRGTRVLQFVSDPVRDTSGVTMAYRTVLIDITETKQLENKLRLLAEAGAVLASSFDSATTLAGAAHLVVPALADLCIIDVLGETGTVERLMVVFADVRKQGALAERMKSLAPRPGWQTPQARVIESGEPMLLSEVSDRAREQDAHDDLHAGVLGVAAIRSLMVVPLSAHGRTLGALTLAAIESDRRFSLSDLRAVQDLASRAALAVDNGRLYDRAQRAIAARDATLAVVSHDLRNSLGVILLKLAAMRMAPPESDRREEGKAIEVIQRAADQMNRLIQDLLDASGIEAGRFTVKRSREPVGPLVKEVLVAWQDRTTAKSLHLAGEFPAGDQFDVDCDSDRIQQTLGNLIGNAIKFTAPGGEIIVRVEPREGELQFSVTDTGPGISRSDLQHVFDRFWQVQQTAHMGSGLGLSIARGIVEAHGGRMWVESEVGVGSTFFFTLKLVAPSAQVVLVVDDNPDARSMVGEILEYAGYRVVTAANGLEALAYLHRASPPAVILLDLAMPVMDGWTFLAERNRTARLRAIPVVVISGQHDVEDRVLAAHASHMTKPVQTDDLLATIRRLTA